MKHKSNKQLIALIILSLVCVWSAVAQEFTMDRYTIGPGGKLTTEDVSSFQLHTTMAQPVAGILQGGPYVLYVGLRTPTAQGDATGLGTGHVPRQFTMHVDDEAGATLALYRFNGANHLVGFGLFEPSLPPDQSAGHVHNDAIGVSNPIGGRVFDRPSRR